MRKFVKATMNDVAREAGVTQATVSNVINGTANVSPELMAKVNNAINKLEYVPNALAKSLKENHTYIVGVIMPDIESGHYSVLANYLTDFFREKGYMVFLCNTNYDTSREREAIETLIQHNVAGIITTYVLLDSSIYKTIIKFKIPVVILDGRYQNENNDIPSVETDNVLGSELLISYLYDIGMRNICLASEPLNRTIEIRLNSYLEAMKKRNMFISNERTYVADHFYNNIDMGYHIGAQILSGPLPDAVCATTDNVAIGILRKFYESNIRVPDDIIVAGFDNISLCQFINPSLTSVSQPREQLAEHGVDLLLKLINNEKITERHPLLKPSLIIRASSTRPKINRKSDPL